MPSVGRADEMNVAVDEAPEAVAIAVAEEAQRLRRVAVLDVDALQVLHVEVVVEAVDERPDELALVEEMHAAAAARR